MNETGRAEDGAPVIAVPLRVRGHKEFNAAPQMGRSEAPLLQKLQCCKGKKGAAVRTVPPVFPALFSAVRRDRRGDRSSPSSAGGRPVIDSRAERTSFLKEEVNGQGEDGVFRLGIKDR